MTLIRYFIITIVILLTVNFANASKRVALVIGNSGYLNAGVLKNPVNDATDVAAALRKLNFKVLLGTDTDYQEMRKLIREFSTEVSSADVATFYYAGHGLSVGGNNYLLPIDASLASKNDLDFQALSLNLVQRQMEQSATTRIIFLDACRNNPLTRSWTSSSRSAASRGLSSPTESTKGTYIAFATQPGNVALDGDGEGARNSPFSTAFLKHVASPGLELSSLMRRVRNDVTIATKDRQVPWSNSGLIGEFYFNPAKAAPEPKTDGNELALWNEVKDSQDAELFKHFIATFPDSIFAGVAKVKLRKMAMLEQPAPKKKSSDSSNSAVSEAAKRSIAACHRLAAHPDDKNRVGSGAEFSELKKNKLKALNACELAVKAVPDNPTLQFQLGRALHAANRFSEAAVMYRKAAAHDNASAQFHMGVLYGYGNLGDKDYPEAARWFRKAAEQEDANAQNTLGILYRDGNLGDKDYPEAARWFRKAAEQGDADAQNNLGHSYETGNGVGKDFVEAVRWYRKAAEQGDATAQTNLGYFYEIGRSVDKNYSTAARWYRKAADQGHARAQYNLGLAYANERGVDKDYAEAARWYRKAAEQGYASAQTSLGYFYEIGRSVDKNYSTAAVWYRKAAEQGDATAQTNLGYFYEIGRSVDKNYSTAVRWYRKAADQGYARAQTSLGYFYEIGRSVDKNSSTAAVWYRKAAGQGYAIAQYNLGVAYEYGRGVEKNYTEAARLYRKAAEQGDADAQNNLGVFYQNGSGLEKNYTEAARWYRKAVEQGNPYAQQNLGQLYEQGKGVSKNSKIAARFVVAALKSGHQLSIDYLKNDSEHSKKFRMEIQRLLKKEGVYSGALDGSFGPGTMRTINRYAKN